MADERVRKLERPADPGDLSAQVRLLAERVRAGLVSSERLGLADHLGDPVARRVVGGAAPAEVLVGPRTPHDLDSLQKKRRRAGDTLLLEVRALERWGREATARAAFAAMDLIRRSRELEGRANEPPQLEPLVMALERLSARATEADLEAAERLGDEAADAALTVYEEADRDASPHDLMWLGKAAEHVALMVRAWSRDPAREPPDRLPGHRAACVVAFAVNVLAPPERASVGELVAAFQRVQAAVRAELIGWALEPADRST